ncbi:helix-turn-helix transcriptional regulator [Longitalea luteola]|uniref:helix-turn-helix transcriptional regulator n=1 Tax=Longitalea luteola TaxID=2812563 RepID=UPI001A97C97E|nr:helix-turn-helix transcriptional regulator [Longitalea luteola]
MENSRISTFVKYNRQRLGLSQKDLAERSGVGLRFIRDLEQGKESLRLDKVNQVLYLFGHIMAPVPSKQFDPYDILLNYLQQNVRIELRNKKVIYGTIISAVYDNGNISGWRVHSGTTEEKFVPLNDIQGIKLGFE